MKNEHSYTSLPYSYDYKLKVVVYFSHVVDTLYSPSYGKCYMFHYSRVQDDKGKVKIVKHPGKSHGKRICFLLLLVLYSVHLKFK